MLPRALRTETFHALHYIGHGAYDTDADRGVLLLEDDSGWARPVSGDQLGMILHEFSSLGLVVLNACEGARASRSNPFSGVAGALVRRDIPAVIAKQSDIGDEAAIAFAGGLYDAIAAGSPVDASLAAARLSMFAERSDDTEWGTPVLFMRPRRAHPRPPPRRSAQFAVNDRPIEPDRPGFTSWSPTRDRLSHGRTG
jgi:CHAT domain-containing protein